MNKSALRSFATNARRELLNKVKAKAMKIGITEEKIKKADFEGADAIFIDGRQLSNEEKTQRQNLIKRIEQKGFNQVMEEVAYTWFNRFTALRFMEINEYLPSNVRVLSSANPEDPVPDIIKEAMSLDFDIDKEWVYERKVKNENDRLFQYLIIKQCNDLYEYLPFMFEKIDDFTEILFPEGLLSKSSFLREMTNTENIPEDDWSNVEIIGWLYQFYITEEKDRVYSQKKKHEKEEIPFVTQLFTPDWIVRYMVQNSLGTYWTQSHPEDEELTEKWKYYIRINHKDAGENGNLNIEEIKCFDPAMGSGHILVYIFDVLFQIYQRCGYLERDIPRLIIENNLYGLDIDDRAYQLASFSVVMKAMEYNRRFLRSIKRHGLNLHLASIQETNEFSKEDIGYFAGESSGDNFSLVKSFFEQFYNGKIYGSLIKVNDIDLAFIEQRWKTIKNNPATDIIENLSREKVVNIFDRLIKQYKIMNNNYDILVTNPPYISIRNMNKDLKSFLSKNYNDSKADTGVTFMELDHYLKSNAISAYVNQHSWMFLTRFENVRKKVIENKTIYTMLHLGSRAFEEIGGEVVQTTAFVVKNKKTPNYNGIYINLVDFKNSDQKKIEALNAISEQKDENRYLTNIDSYKNIPGYPFSYWIGEGSIKAIENGVELETIAKPRVGLQTSDNKRFLRFWFEPSNENVGYGFTNRESAKNSKYKWFPYNKGGEFRKWFGNNYYVVNWENDGFEIREYNDYLNASRSSNIGIANTKFYFRESITWSFVSSSNFAVRYSPKGFIFDTGGSSVFADNEMIYYLTAFLCSKVTFEFLKIQNPTLNFQPGNIAKLPVIVPEKDSKEQIDIITKKNISLSQKDWDSFEISWNFKKHPILMEKSNVGKIEDSFKSWKTVSEQRFLELKNNEQKLNQLFINIYNLNEEITPEVMDEDVTIRISDQEREIISFISYAVGCMLGRYSLDQDGLAYAGGEFDLTKYQTFKADEDNVLPVLPGAYFKDDIVSRFVDFVKVTFGEATLAENLDFIANTLGKKKNETAKETIRRYFLNDFFNNHLKIYKKRPIYWLFTSGKQRAFNCLIYMHRYDSTTLGRIRTDYLHELQTRMDAEKESLMNIIDGDSTSKEINQAKKDLKSLEKKIEELKEYDEVLHHMADQQIELNLDEGVEVNYEKFKDLLAKK